MPSIVASPGVTPRPIGLVSTRYTSPDDTCAAVPPLDEPFAPFCAYVILFAAGTDATVKVPLNELFVTPAITTLWPTENVWLTPVVTVTVFVARVIAEIAIASLCGVSVSIAVAAAVAEPPHVSTPSVRRITMYGRHCVLQQFDPVQVDDG